MHCSKTNNPRSVMKFAFRKNVKTPEKSPVPVRTSNRLSRLMALAIRFEDMLQSGEVVDYSELASRYGVDRGRISRVMHLRLLAPDLQEALLDAPTMPDTLSLKHVLPVCKIDSWRKQRAAFDELVANQKSPPI